MTSKEIVRVKNVLSKRSTVYLVAIAFVTSIIILLLGFYLGYEPFLIAAFSIAPFVLLIFDYLGGLRVAVEVTIVPHGIQLLYRRGKTEDIPWKNIVSLKPVPLDPGFFNLAYFNENGVKSFETLSETPAKHVRQMWNVVFPAARDLENIPTT